MPSLNGKLSMLADSYEHSKSSPAYRDLKIKYKALKQQNQELLNLIARLFSDFGGVHESPTVEAPTVEAPSKKSKDTQIPELVEDEPAINIIVEEQDEEGITEEDFEVQEELDSDIKEQFIEETAAEIFMINRGTDTDYDESDERVEVVIEAEEESEAGEVEVVVEEIEVEEEEEEVEEEEVVEEEVVEEEEEIEEEVEVEEEIEEDVVEEEEAGVYEIEFDGKRYYTTNEQNGIVYELVGEDDVGDEIGKFVNGKLVLNK